MNKNKLEEIRKENERLEYEFWKDFYDTKKVLTQTLEHISKSETNNHLKEVNN